MALAGGLLASAAMAASACVQWALSGTPADAPAALLRALHDLAFVTGGPWRAAGLGLLLAGVAVSSGDHRLLSRPVWIAGVVLAVLCELATLTLALPAAYLIPLRRFGGLAWLIVAGLHLPVHRAHRGTGCGAGRWRLRHSRADGRDDTTGPHSARERRPGRHRGAGGRRLLIAGRDKAPPSPCMPGVPDRLEPGAAVPDDTPRASRRRCGGR
jgi:hypothetical protein